MTMQLMTMMGLLIVACILQKNYKIPSPVFLMSAVMVGAALNVKVFEVDSAGFDNLVLLTLPLLIAADSLKLHVKDLKEHGLSLFWVAVISVLLSVGVGVLINDFVLVDYPLSMAAVVLLFCMVCATDPITVSALFSNFNVPHKLKVLTEGESLFNDATALIVFSIALVALNKPDEITVWFITIKSLSVVFGALLIGALIGYLTTWLMRMSDEPFVETLMLLFGAYAAYLCAEHFHFSGILAVIVSMCMAKRVIDQVIEKNAQPLSKGVPALFGFTLSSKENQFVMLKSIDFLALCASSLLFISIASIVDFQKLWHYKYEVLALFVASTLIRALMMLKFAWVSNRVSMMQGIQKHWWAVLTGAGSKGALSILMVHLLPANFEYKVLFETLIVGTILLSTFVYALALSVIFIVYKQRFDQEASLDNEH